MSKQINYWNQTIESKIQEFKEGTDYVFTGGENHSSKTIGENKKVGNDQCYAMNIRGYKSRNYDIISPKLKKIVREMFHQKFTILASYPGDNGGRLYSESYGCDDNYSRYRVMIDDINGDFVDYRQDWGRNKHSEFCVREFDDKDEEKELFEMFKKAEINWEEKRNGQDLTLINSVPLEGTKCWNCSEEITKNDIIQGNYCVYNARNFSSIHRRFCHLEKEGKCREAQDRKRGNYSSKSRKEKSFPSSDLHYFWGLEAKWDETRQNEWLCRDYLQKLLRDMRDNLNYLEQQPQNEEGDKEIVATRIIIAEIEERLQKVKEQGRWDDCDNDCSDCGIKLCCHKKSHQDCPPKDKFKGELEYHDSHNTDNDKKGNKSLNADSISFVKENNNQATSADFLRKILNWMKQEKISTISLDSDSGELVIKYNSQSEISGNNILTNSLSKELKSYFRQNTTQSFNQQDLEKQISQNPQKQGWMLPVIGISFLVLLITLVIVKKKSKKEK